MGRGVDLTAFMGFICSLLIIFLVAAGCTHNQSVVSYNYSENEAVYMPDNSVDSELTESYNLPDNPRLEDYIKYALFHSKELQAAFEKWRAALMKIPQVKTLPDPRFTYSYYVERVETRVGPQKQSFAISQTFPWLAKLQVAGDVAAEEAKRRKAEYEVVKWNVTTRVKKAYFDYVYLERTIKITRDNLELLKHLEMTIQSRYASSLTAYGNLLRLQTEMGRLENRLASLEDLREALIAEFNAALNRPSNAPVPDIKEPNWPGDIDISEKDAVKKLILQNPDLKVLEKQMGRERKSIKLAEMQFFPDLTVSVSTIDTGDAENPAVNDSGKNPVIVGFSVNIPLWWNKYKSGVQENIFKFKSTRDLYESKKYDLMAHLKKVIFKWKDAERKIDLYKNGLIPKANQAFWGAIKSYETGDGSYTDVIDAERMLLEFQIDLERAIAERAKWIAEFERILGENIATRTGK